MPKGANISPRIDGILVSFVEPGPCPRAFPLIFRRVRERIGVADSPLDPTIPFKEGESHGNE